jgi:hypothetical protein
MKEPIEFLKPYYGDKDVNGTRLYTHDEAIAIIQAAQLDAHNYKDRIVNSLFRIRNGEEQVAKALAGVKDASLIPAALEPYIKQPKKKAESVDGATVETTQPLDESFRVDMGGAMPVPTVDNISIGKKEVPARRKPRIADAIPDVPADDEPAAPTQPRKGGKFAARKVTVDEVVLPKREKGTVKVEGKGGASKKTGTALVPEMKVTKGPSVSSSNEKPAPRKPAPTAAKRTTTAKPPRQLGAEPPKSGAAKSTKSAPAKAPQPKRPARK